MIRPTILRRLGLLCAAAAVCAAGHAQNTTQGAIAGTVFDATNAAIPGATVTIHNNATNAELKLTSDNAGIYKAPQLNPGSYTVTVTAPGFTTVQSKDVVVEVNVSTEFDPHLTTGGETQVVEVSAAVPVLNFNDATYGGHLENKEIENIPINNRRWSQLALLTPSATPNSDGFGLIAFHAISPLLNTVEVDGADDNQAFFSEERGRTRAGYSTSQAAVREFQVNSGTYSAEYGRAVGAVINSVTKQGGNQIHGEAYFYNRKSSRAAFIPGASNTYNTGTASAPNYVTIPYKPSDNRNQFGFQASGALIKDRLFWSYAFDEFRRNFPGTAKANTPGTFFVNADAALPASASCGSVNATTGAYTAATGATATPAADQAACLLAFRQAAVANPTVAQTSVTPAQYATAAALYNTQLTALLGDLGSVPRFGDQEINTPRLDYQLNDKHHVSLLYHRLRWDSPGGVQTQATNNYALDTFGTDFVKLDYGVAELESAFTTRLANELRFQYGRELNDEGQQPYTAYTAANLMGAGGVVPEVNLNQSVGFYMGSPYYSYRVAYPDERKWQIGDTASFTFGKHTLRFGEDIVHNYDVQNNLYESNGFYTYGAASGSSSVNYFSDRFITGGKSCPSSSTGVATPTTGFYPCYSSYAQSFGQPILTVTTTDYGFFVQDDWKVTPRLTLNLGVRYDYEALPKPFAPNSAVPNTQQVPSDKNNFGPRIGFAWDPYGAGKTTVRGGFGLYYGRVFNSALLNALENTGAGISATGASTSQAAYSFSSTTTGAPLLPNTALTLPPAGAIGPSVEYIDPHAQNPYSEQMSLAIQQEIGANTVASISYFGALSRELPNYLNVDLDPTKTYTLNYTVSGTGNCGPLACGTTVPVKVYSNKTQTGPTAGTYSYNLLNPAYNGITAVTTNINSNYHALTGEIQRRAGKFITFDANYTWAHALDFNQSTSTTFTAGNSNWFDPYANARANYANSLLDIRHRVVAWALVTLPGTGGHGVLGSLTNGWSINPLLQFQTGLPYSVLVSGNPTNQCSVAGCLESNSSGLSGTGVTYIPLIGRNTQRYPATVNNDIRLAKKFTVAEKYNFELYGEAFNAANHRNVTGINTTAYNLGGAAGTTAAATTATMTYSSSFGQITSANSNFVYQPRQIQIAVRMTF